jgi:hypothetical protein
MLAAAWLFSSNSHVVNARNSGGIVSVVAVESVQRSLYVLSVPSRLEVKRAGPMESMHDFSNFY